MFCHSFHIICGALKCIGFFAIFRNWWLYFPLKQLIAHFPVPNSTFWAFSWLCACALQWAVSVLGTQGGAWKAAVRGVAEGRTRLSDFIFNFQFSLSHNPLRCSCLENPRDGGAWWASVYGVAQSRTGLKWLSSSSSSSVTWGGFKSLSSTMGPKLELP